MTATHDMNTKTIERLPAVPYMRRIEPIIPAGHPKFVWTAGADVQATWRRFGWTPSKPTEYALSQGVK